MQNMDLTVVNGQAFSSSSIRAPFLFPCRLSFSDTKERSRLNRNQNRKVSIFFGSDIQLHAAQINVRRQSFHAQAISSTTETSTTDSTDRHNKDPRPPLTSTSGQSTLIPRSSPPYRAPVLPGKPSVKVSPDKAPSAISNMKYFATVSPPDCGPPRWFCPTDARPRTAERGSAKGPLPKLLFIPGETLPLCRRAIFTQIVSKHKHLIFLPSTSLLVSGHQQFMFLSVIRHDACHLLSYCTVA